MYIIIDKITHESTIIKEKTTLSTIIGKSISTIYRNETENYWETAKYYVYNPKKVLIKSNRGGKSNFRGSNSLF